MSKKHIRKKFTDVLDQHSVNIEKPEGWDWYNSIYEGKLFNMGHVHHYTGDPVEVIHVLLVPYSSQPIFGFDVVWIAGNATLICADFSPTVDEVSWECPYENNREVPEWASFFSEDVLFRSPTGKEEVKEISDYFSGRLDDYINNLRDEKPKEDVIKAQNRYMKMQRKNSKTFKSLAADIGEENAKRYMTKVQFPKIKND